MDTHENERIRRRIQKIADEKDITFDQAADLVRRGAIERSNSVLNMPRGKGSRSPYNRPKTKRK